MTKTPGESPGSSALPEARAYTAPWLALLLGAFGYAGTVLILIGYPGLRAQLIGAPGWALALLDLVVICLPLVVAVLAAGAIASRIGIAGATGIRQWRGLDLLLGLGVGLLLRAVVELVVPTTGALGGPFNQLDLLTTAVTVAGVVLISPYIEEWFFRGLVLRALLDALDHLDRVVAATIAIVVSTVAFGALHFLPWGSAIGVGEVFGTLGTGLACGILTVVTGRLGAALVAHIAYNAIGVVLLLL